MIIESAFTKLPEFLISHSSSRIIYESTIVQLFNSALLLELDSRNIPRYFENVFLEYPYTLGKTATKNLRTDIFVRHTLQSVGSDFLSIYGMKENNWIEVKAFLSKSRTNSDEAKTKNIGLILKDIFRLCFFPEELQGNLRKNNRYLLILFSSSPNKALAFNARRANRDWLSSLFREGFNEIEINLNRESQTLLKAMGKNFNNTDIVMRLKIRTYMFRPDDIDSNFGYWGYLIRIEGYYFKDSNFELDFYSYAKQHCDANFMENLNALRKYIHTKIYKLAK